MEPKENWQTISARKKSSNLEKIPAEWRLPADVTVKCTEDSSNSVMDIPATCGILAEQEIAITEKYDATQLLELIATGKLKALEVTLAFCKRAAIAHQLVNCLTEIFFEKAMHRAMALDKYYEQHKKTIGPLHGLPISLKDSFNLKGVATTVAYVSFASNPPLEFNSNLVDLLDSQGAVFYVKTNIPQTMMTADSDNPLFGRTLNPRNLSLTAGGSTGGEGALIALRGSLMGAGTDVAGSLRIPALCNGIYGFKPTSRRVPFGGKTPPGRIGSPSPILPTIGSEAHSVRDLELFMKSVIRAKPWESDEDCLPFPWRELEPIEHGLRIGVILEDSMRPLHPTMKRTMDLAMKCLEKKGHTMIFMKDQISLWDISIQAWSYFMLDPKKTPLQYVGASGEPWVKSIVVTKHPELANYEASLDLLWDMNARRRQMIKHFFDWMKNERLDVVMMPPYQTTAVPHDTYGTPIYTVLANYLDWPAGSIPFLKADHVKDADYMVDTAILNPPYLPEAVEGMPSGIQLLTSPYRDEELLQIMEAVDRTLKGSQPG